MRLNPNKPKTKVCPRCGLKILEGIDECPDCGLVFSRLNIATNKEAKRKKLRGDRDFIIKTKQIPRDVSYIKLLLLSIFFGSLGAHCFYVGRYLRGSMLLCDFLVLLSMVIFNEPIMIACGESTIALISTICGLILLTWFWDIGQIAVKKFKIPVAIDIESDLENINEENSVVSDEVIEDKVVETKTEIKEDKSQNAVIDDKKEDNEKPLLEVVEKEDNNETLEKLEDKDTLDDSDKNNDSKIEEKQNDKIGDK